jgi:hypothetical protein
LLLKKNWGSEAMEDWTSELSVRLEKTKFVAFSEKIDYFKDFKAAHEDVWEKIIEAAAFGSLSYQILAFYRSEGTPLNISSVGIEVTKWVQELMNLKGEEFFDRLWDELAIKHKIIKEGVALSAKERCKLMPLVVQAEISGKKCVLLSDTVFWDEETIVRILSDEYDYLIDSTEDSELGEKLVRRLAKTIEIDGQPYDFKDRKQLCKTIKTPYAGHKTFYVHAFYDDTHKFPDKHDLMKKTAEAFFAYHRNPNNEKYEKYKRFLKFNSRNPNRVETINSEAIQQVLGFDAWTLIGSNAIKDLNEAVKERGELEEIEIKFDNMLFILGYSRKRMEGYDVDSGKSFIAFLMTLYYDELKKAQSRKR